ncbi:MAG: sensor histidine kinase KdpD [Phycisphaeraceae bacterium]|nr:sensor histidine kinase KdpD [Phycisphaeraceae bacterium]
METPLRDPEAMLARLRTQEPQTLESHAARRGKLKIFFGYAAGVGKTYTMLESARAAAISGRDVLLGYIEPHNRPETEALLLGQDLLPQQEIDYRGIRLREFDLDGALHRKPSLILVDELAHTNAAGSRHNKRWQDVEELLDAGIDVWSTLNVQHIESLNDIVAQITGIVVRETIPDRTFDEADEVELVDLPPDELLERVQAGKVYMTEQAERAGERFFRKANLIALRELAMRRIADRVGHDVQTARMGHARTQVWPTTERLLVCVGPSPTSAKVIRTAKRMASAMHAQWIAVHTETAATGGMDDRARHRLNQHLKLAERLGAETVTITGEDVADEIIRYAQSRNVTKIVIGKTGRPPWHRFGQQSVVDRLIARSGDIDIYVIRGVEEHFETSTPRTGKQPWLWRPYIAAAGVLGVATLVGMTIGRFGMTDPNIVMTYLLAVVLVAVWIGRGPAVFASLAAVLLFNFFFTRPYYTFSVDNSDYVFTFIVMLAVALIVSALTVRIGNQVRLARQRERRTEVQYRVSQALANTSGRLQIAMAAEEHLTTIFGGEIAVFAVEDGAMRPLVRRGHGFTEIPAELEAARWVFEHKQIAGRGTDTLPAAQAMYLPLQGAEVAVGAIGWRPLNDDDLLSIERRQLLESFATQIALALERDRLAHDAQRILAEAQAERLRSSLLSAVSHDLRTPLAAIAGSASAMLERNHDDATRHDLLRTIYEEADRLARLVDNLLHLTRIESGSLKVRKQWQPLDEVVGSALHRVEPALRSRAIETSIPADLGLVPLDGLLIEQVLVNLLDNAAKYTPADSAVTVSARQTPDGVDVEIADRGPGLDEAERERVFDKFYRSCRVSSDRGRGAGLGLAICRAIIQAHGGNIRALPRDGGGTRFVFTLPMEGLPPRIDTDIETEDGAHHA